MRTVRLSLVSVIAVALVGTWAGPVTSQEVPNPMADPAFFTYTTEPVTDSDMPDEPVVRGHADMQRVEATDPRASGLMSMVVNSNLVGLHEGGVMTALMALRLTNDGGAWSGSGRYVMASSGYGGMMVSMNVLTGEGAYEGLTLIMGGSAGAGSVSEWGVIVPSDQMPPMPDLVGPAAE